MTWYYKKKKIIINKQSSAVVSYITLVSCIFLDFIVRQLEIMSCKLQADQSLVFRAILNIGVSLEQVLDIYIK